MRLEPGCPRCSAAVEPGDAGVRCETHGTVTPLLRAASADYDTFVDHLTVSRPLPTWLPWPLPPDWQVGDFGAVAAAEGRAVATFATCFGLTADGVVELVVITEEPGVGLAARCAGLTHDDPGEEATRGTPMTRVTVGEATVPLWQVAVGDTGSPLDRVVLAGEHQGRWFWLVGRPASVAFVLPELSPMQDLAAMGPELLGVPFGALPRSW